MKAFRFSHKPQLKVYILFTILALAFSILIFTKLNQYVNIRLLFLFSSIASSISMYITIKKASKEFEEIMILEDEIKFYFQNKMKDPILLSKKNVKVTVLEDKIEFIKIDSSKIIGTAHKNKLENSEEWKKLVLSVNTANSQLLEP